MSNQKTITLYLQHDFRGDSLIREIWSLLGGGSARQAVFCRALALGLHELASRRQLPRAVEKVFETHNIDAEFHWGDNERQSPNPPRVTTPTPTPTPAPAVPSAPQAPSAYPSPPPPPSPPAPPAPPSAFSAPSTPPPVPATIPQVIPGDWSAAPQDNQIHGKPPQAATPSADNLKLLEMLIFGEQGKSSPEKGSQNDGGPEMGIPPNGNPSNGGPKDGGPKDGGPEMGVPKSGEPEARRTFVPGGGLLARSDAIQRKLGKLM